MIGGVCLQNTIFPNLLNTGLPMNMSNGHSQNIKISLNFSVESFDFEYVKDMRFMKGTIHAFADGPNAYTHPISTQVLMDCANSVYDIPIVCRYNGFTDDFMSHEADETPIGFVKETSPTYSNPIIFEKSADGRTFIVIKALIWKKYAEDAVRVLKNSNGKKSVSVEITVTKSEEIDGKIKVNEFVLEGITVLGDFVRPAVKDANIQVEFAKDKKEFLDSLQFSESKTETGDNMENVTDTALYASPTEGAENAGVACANAVCAEDAACATQYSEGVACSAQNTEDAGQATVTQENAPESDSKAPVEPQSNENDIDPDDHDDEPDDDDDEPDDDKPDDDDDDSIEAQGVDYAGGVKRDGSCQMSLDEAMDKIAKMAARIDELEAQNKAYMSELELKKDYDDLKAFKERTEAKIKLEEDMRLINDVLTEIKNRGYDMSDAEKEQLKLKFSEFDSADAWANYAKAQAFENGNKTDSGVQKIGLPYANAKPTQSIWDII